MKRTTLAAVILLALPACDDAGPKGPARLVREFEAFYPRQLVDVEGTLFFIAYDRLHGSEVWRSNGTPDGTRMVKDVTPGPDPPDGYGSCRGCLAEPASLTRVDRRLFFIANDGRHGWEPWVSDGSDAGTRMVQDVAPGASPSQLGSFVIVELRGSALFTAHEPVLGQELWRSDGTARGTGPVRDIGPGRGGVVASTLFSAGDRAYLLADDGVHGVELWRSDGTESGTVLLADIAPGPASSQVVGFVRDANTGVDYFTAYDGSAWALWRTDGTPAGTAPLARVPAGAKVVGAAKRLLLTLADAEHGEELWASDGTAEGTELLKDILPGRFSSFPTGFLHLGDTVLFSAQDGEHGFELWRTDGTREGTTMVRDIAPGAAPGSPHGLARAGRVAYFTARDADAAVSLWVTDGTAAGTRLVPAGDGEQVSPPVVVSGSRVFFTTCNLGGTGRCGLWALDIR
jgi:ELWxxDGT repeat protein